MRATTTRLLGRYALVFLIAFVGLLALGRGLSGNAGASGDNHFVHMAHGWLDGRLALEGDPPGYDKGRADDWARIWTIELDDRQSFRGHRCRTRACADQEQERGVQMWWTTKGELVRTERRHVSKRHTTWYVSFPPGPALLMLPGTAIWGLDFSDIIFTAFLAACIPVVLLWFLDRERGVSREHLWVAAAWTFASPACFVGANGRVWFTAQIAAALAMTLYLSCAWRLRRPICAGLLLGLATACRPHLGLAALVFAAIWWQHGRPKREAMAFGVPLLMCLAGLAVFNELRFDDPFEFGHRYLAIRWQARMQEVGMFSSDYLLRNATCLVAMWPQWQTGAPALRISIHGLGLLWTTPWLLWSVRSRAPFDERMAMWVTAALIALPTLFYHNSGQLQFSYRFALDWLPLVLVAMAFGGITRWRGFRLAVALAIIVHSYGAWAFAHAPKRLFVSEPVGWPFQSEFER